MLTEPSVAFCAQSNSDFGLEVLPQYSFIQQSDNVNASKTRRAVRSHAMRSVRRQRRQESANDFRLKWPDEQASGKNFQPTGREQQSSDSGEQPQRPEIEGRIQKRRHDTEFANGTALLEWSEPAGSNDDYDPLPLRSQSTTDPPSEPASSLQRLGRGSFSPYTTVETGEEVTPIGENARTLLGAGRLDPFQTLPITASGRNSELVDHCAYYPPLNDPL